MSSGVVGHNELLLALHSVNSIRRSAIISALLLLAGVLAVLGSVYYSATRLAPLRAELVELDRQIYVRAERNAELLQAIEQSQAELEETRRALDAAKAALADIETRGLSQQSRDQLTVAAEKIDSAGKALAASEASLQAPADTANASETGLRQAIEGLFASRATERLKAYDVLIEKYSKDPQLIPELLEHARNNPGNENGVYNTLVTLSHLRKTQLKPYAPEIKEFAASAASNGDRTKQRADVLIARLPE